jgi:hypothetical protein
MSVIDGLLPCVKNTGQIFISPIPDPAFNIRLR